MEDALLRCFEYATLQVVEGQRSELFPLVHKFSCVNKALAAAARADQRVPFLIAYFLSPQLPSGRAPTFFFEGVPR